MKINLIHVLALFILMLITGVFWGTWFTLTRSIESFSSDEFIHIGKVIIQNVALPMRFILPSGILLIILSLWFHKNKKTVGFYCGLGSLILLISVLLITLIVLVPIDNEIKTWSGEILPRNWENIRNTWKAYHALRTFASLVGFGCYTLFVLNGNQS